MSHSRAVCQSKRTLVDIPNVHTEGVVGESHGSTLLRLSNVHEPTIAFALGLLIHVLAGGICRAEVDVAAEVESADGSGHSAWWTGIGVAWKALALVEMVEIDATGVGGALIVFRLALVKSVDRHASSAW